MNDLLEFWKSVDTHILIEIGLTLVLIMLFFIVKKIVVKADQKSCNQIDALKFEGDIRDKTCQFWINLIFITLIAIVWEISFRGLSVYFASFFTIVGVAFFASWSILSNVTAYAILFFYFPFFKIGSKIKIIDGDNSVQRAKLMILRSFLSA
jgi:MscS family membrane protein